MSDKKNVNINKKTSSLIINNLNENNITATNSIDDSSSKTKKKSKTKKLLTEEIATKEIEEQSKLEFEEQINTIKKIKNFLNMEVSTFLKKCISLVEKINNKLFGSLKKKKEEEKADDKSEEIKEETRKEVFSFKSFLEMNIIFTDNKRVPLYSIPKNKNSMYEYNDEVLNASTIAKIKEVFIDTSNKLKKIPVPDKGKYKGIPLDVIMKNITDEQLYEFLFYVKRFPSKYIGKNYRISESFAAWVMSGTPDN